MMHNKKYLNCIAMALVVFACFVWVFFIAIQDFKTHNFITITINGASVYAEVVDTKISRQKGLSGRQKLPYGEAMLFVFEKEGFHSLWMRNMNFAIDIIWIDKNGVIVDIKKNALPNSYPNTYLPKKPALFVLETNKNFVLKNKISIGDMVNFETLNNGNLK